MLTSAVRVAGEGQTNSESLCIKLLFATKWLHEKDMCALIWPEPLPWEFLALNNRFAVAAASETIPPAVLTVTIT